MRGLLLLVLSAVAMGGEDPCTGFKWDAAHERQVFAMPPMAVTAAREGDSPPLLEMDRLFDLTLAPAGDVHLPTEPARRRLADGAFAGIVRIHVPAEGEYRVSLSEPFWVDVVDLMAAAQIVKSSDFSGAPGCHAPHKIVQYRLHAGDFLLQVSDGASAHVLLTWTRVRNVT